MPPRHAAGRDIRRSIYMKYKKTETVLIIFICLIFLVFIGLLAWWISVVHSNVNAGNMRLDTRATKEEMAEDVPDLSQRNVFFAGMEDTTIKKGGKISLENLEQNLDFYMKYKVYDAGSDKLIYETDLIPSGERILWDPSEVLGIGEHTIAFLEEPYMQQGDGYIPLTSGKNIVNITITL